MSDKTTSVMDLRELVHRFVDARDWQQFHSPKNLSMAMAIEAAELMEHFQWITAEASRKINENKESLEAVSEELADVVCYALAIANELGIDVSESMRRKMIKNEVKYPAAEFRGRYGPEDQRT